MSKHILGIRGIKRVIIIISARLIEAQSTLAVRIQHSGPHRRHWVCLNIRLSMVRRRYSSNPLLDKSRYFFFKARTNMLTTYHHVYNRGDTGVLL